MTIIECDMNVDFEAPPGYQEPTRAAPVPMEEEEPELDISQMLPEKSGFIAFAGSGNRLDGKKRRTNSETLKIGMVYNFESSFRQSRKTMCFTLIQASCSILYCTS